MQQQNLNPPCLYPANAFTLLGKLLYEYKTSLREIYILVVTERSNRIRRNYFAEYPAVGPRLAACHVMIYNNRGLAMPEALSLIWMLARDRGVAKG